ncbi:MAG: class I SAM-dependent methyltransferase [Acidimicrobiia bacterium]
MDERHWFEDVADHLGEAYLRYSFTKGTVQEVAFLIGELELAPGVRVLDVGCGPGRHAHALAEAGIEVVGVDISERFIDLAGRDAPAGATFVRADARELAYDAEFDAVISLCQGAFGLAGGPGAPLDPDGVVLAGMTRAVKPGGRLALSAFSSYFAVRHLDGPGFDVDSGVHHETFEVKDPEARTAKYDAWTTCFTPRELRLMVAAAGLELLAVYSVEPGDYARRPPDIEHPEFLLTARRP